MNPSPFPEHTGALAPGQSVYFISDAHLGVPDHASSLVRERKLVAWLDRAAPDAAAIHLVGDLFDFWFEYGQVVPRGFVRLLGRLAELRDRGIPIFAYTGNHDLWLFDYFERELGIPVFRSPQRWTYGNRTFLVGHGDGVGPGDHGYKFIKAVFSNRLCQWAFRLIHPDAGIGLALFWSRKSRQADAGRDESFQFEREPQVIWAREQLRLQPFDFVVMGHRHCPTIYPLDEKSTFVNLGDWISHFSYVRFQNDALELAYVESSEKPAGTGSAAHQRALTWLGCWLGVALLLFLSGTANTTAQSLSLVSSARDESANPFEQKETAPYDVLYEIREPFEDLALDGLGNLFTLSPDGEIRRYNEQGKLLYRFSEVRLGRVGSMDVSNPLRVLVYYPEFLTVVLLTNTLAISGELDLRPLGFNRVRAAGLARDGRIWLYDEANFQLVKIDERGQVIRRSEPLSYVLDLNLQPVALSERNNRLFLLDPQHGILVFDAFGTYDYRFGGSGIVRMQAYAEQVLFEREGRYYYQDLSTYQEGEWMMPEPPFRAWSMESRRLALLRESGISVYPLP